MFWPLGYWTRSIHMTRKVKRVVSNKGGYQHPLVEVEMIGAETRSPFLTLRMMMGEFADNLFHEET
jgi:hypothetical protein